VAVALTGVLIGFAASTLGYRYRFLHVPGEGPLQRMDRVLKLTPMQREQIQEVMDGARERVESSRHDFQRNRRQILIDSYTKIRTLLTPEQQRDFDRDFVPPNLRYSGGHHMGTWGDWHECTPNVAPPGR
jgi:Spy/CpxP family protein refolding chaperone